MCKQHLIRKMALMNTWPSALIISQKIVKCEWTDILGVIVERVDRNLSHKVVEKVPSNAQFMDLVHKLSLDGPVELLKDYSMNVHTSKLIVVMQTQGGN